MDRACRRRVKIQVTIVADPMERESKSSDRDAPYGLMKPLELRIGRYWTYPGFVER